MKIGNIHIVAAFLAALVPGQALADPCTVESSKDDLNTSSTLRYVVEEFLNDRTDKPCSASGYEDGEYFDQSVGFLTDEANSSSKPDVNQIELTDVLRFDMKHEAVIGNVSQDALDDAETDHDSDVAYETDGNKGNDGDSYTKSGGEVKDYGMVVIDARELGKDVNPFSCASDSESVFLRNMIILTDSVTIGEVFNDCVKDGGNAWVCAYDYKEGSDPRSDSDWCERTWVFERLPLDPGLWRFPQRWYADDDGDGYGDPNDSILIRSGEDGYGTGRDGYVTRDHSDCDDTDAEVNPAATEICDGIDNNCDEVIDTDAVDRLDWYQDADADAYGNANVRQSACDKPDGYVADDTDCDDTDPALTTDCSAPPTWYRDADGDGYGDPVNSTAASVQPDGYVANDDDCDDTDPTLALDCSILFFWFRDADSDGYGDPEVVTTALTQPEGYVNNAGDCDDADSDKAFDCDGDSGTWYADRDEDGYGNWFDAVTSIEAPDGYVDNAGDCDDTDPTLTTSCRGEGAGADPAAECSDGIDNDADGLTDCADSPCLLFAICIEVNPSVNPNPDTSAGGSGFNGQLEGSVFSGGGCSLSATGGADSPGPGMAWLAVLALLVMMPIRIAVRQ